MLIASPTASVAILKQNYQGLAPSHFISCLQVDPGSHKKIQQLQIPSVSRGEEWSPAFAFRSTGKQTLRHFKHSLDNAS